MGVWLSLLAALGFALLFPLTVAAQIQPEITEPHLLSVFPSGGNPGDTVRAEFRGVLVAGAYAVWSATGGLGGRVQKVEETDDKFPEKKGPADTKTKPHAVYRVLVELEISPSTRAGNYSLRLVTPQGVSSGIPFRVVNMPVTAETREPHETPKQAQAIQLPAIIFARLAKPGDSDYYSFRAPRGQEVSFQVVGAPIFDPRLALYRAGGSWFDPDRAKRVLMEEERTTDLMNDEARGSYRVPEDGEYFLEVSSLFGKGGADCTYQLRFASRQASREHDGGDNLLAGQWSERSFTRELEEDWVKALAARTVQAGETPAAPPAGAAATQGTGTTAAAGLEASPAPPLPASPSSAREQEPNNLAAQAQTFTLPAILEGSIDRPGDVDCFRFKVEAGQRVAIEVETPEARPPHFNPRLGIVDSEDRELFSNVDRRLSMYNNNADPHVFLKALSPKSTYTFERGGEYVLQVRDITSRYGDTSFRYRILVRPEIPHVGEVTVEGADEVNLFRGKPKRLVVTAAYEEGFAGDVSFSFDGLPPGVDALPAAKYDDGRAPLEVPQNANIVAPKTQKAAIVLVAGSEAALTSQPILARLYCHPIVQDKLGPKLLVREIPVMVVEEPSKRIEPPEKWH